MSLELATVGSTSGPVEVTWTSRDTLLYAVAVGAGAGDPAGELAFTTENSEGIDQQVLPVYGVLIVQNAGIPRDVGDYDPAALVHAEQSLTSARSLPVAGTALVSQTVAGIYDKGSGALVVTEAQAVDATSGELLLTARSSAFIKGEGGFGGSRGPTTAWTVPARSPDHVVSFATRPEQALLYRLCGDRNPLHSDPAFAARGGFESPILHGMCTYGITGRLLLDAACDGDPARFRSIEGRFTRPVTPGEELTVSMWRDDSAVLFTTTDSTGAVVIDKGTMTLAEAGAGRAAAIAADRRFRS
ncbi:MAG: enoyl-CoA hydratase [Pseudonocardiaceae bacterium]|nr:enoyl-CoA hydratase [Pseudonocardiaceae bacterium]